MQKEIKGLRRKFFILSASVTFAVIFIMLFILNLLMQMSANDEIKTAADMVIQAACSNVPGMESETISLKNMERNSDGNLPIYRDPTTIESVTLNGELFCDNEDELWYSGGGGLYFGLTDKSGNTKFINKEYKFNRDNTEITVDFLDNSNYMLDGEKVETDIAFVSKEGFYISPVWWTASSQGLNPGNITLELYSIDILYRKNIDIPYSENHQAVKRDYTEIFSGGVPQTLSNFSSFYFILSNTGKIMEINNGNITETVLENDINKFIQKQSDTIKIDNVKYDVFTKKTENFKVYAFLNNVQSEKNSSTLIIVSLLSGGIMFVLVIILIYFVSGRAVKPISESFRKQKEFISNVSHELKTPITVISATTELMERKNGPDKLAECIRAQSEKMGKLVNEMLMLTRLTEAKQNTIDFKQFDLSETVRKTVLYFEGRAFEEEKEISADIYNDIIYNGAAEKIENLISILLDNAIKYSEEKSKIDISLKCDKENIIIKCENLCSEFNESGKDKLFERFYRGDESHSGEKEGFGLGLSIAKEITDLHGGKISAVYKDGRIAFKIVFKQNKKQVL